MATDGPKLSTALHEAQTILDAAEARVREIIGDAEKNAELARAQAYREGYDQGRHDAVQKAVRMLEDSATLSDRFAEQAAKLALKVASYVIRDHVKAHPETVKKMALHALQESVVGEQARITVHPDDEPVLSAALGELKQIASGASILLDVDSSLTRGGCVVRTDFGEVDSTIEALIGSLASRFGIRPENT